MDSLVREISRSHACGQHQPTLNITMSTPVCLERCPGTQDQVTTHGTVGSALECMHRTNIIETFIISSYVAPQK